jgi:O-methyltransferase involved in polyketide biosynthesis
VTADSSGSAPRPVPVIDTTVPHSARIWNYWLGGKDNYEVDRMAGDQFLRMFPDIAVIARATRAFMGRAIRYLAAEEGVRQFLDVGTGLPTFESTHEIAQQVAPESRIVYVDNDPVVLLHAETLLVSAPEGATDYIDADMREPQRVIQAAAKTLDFSRPVAILFMGVLGHVTDDDEAVSLVRRLLDAVPSGSYLVLSDGTNVVHGDQGEAAQEEYNESGAEPYALRSPEQIARFFDGLQLVEPGLVSVTRWRPDPNAFGLPPEVDALGGVGRKP